MKRSVGDIVLQGIKRGLNSLLEVESFW